MNRHGVEKANCPCCNTMVDINDFIEIDGDYVCIECAAEMDKQFQMIDEQMLQERTMRDES